MKKFYLLLSFVAAFASVSAQDFTFTPNYQRKQQFGNNGDIVCYSSFKNNSASDSVFTWIRIENTKPADWESEVCDPDLCWLVTTDSAQFTVSPDSTGIFRVTFIVPNTSGHALTRLRVYANSDPMNSDTVEFEVNGWGTSIREGSVSVDPGVFPSPVSRELNLTYRTDRPIAAEIYNLAGVKVDSFTYFNEAYDAGKLAPGIYLIRLFANDSILTSKFSKAE
jgi:hypothetical protein